MKIASTAIAAAIVQLTASFAFAGGIQGNGKILLERARLEILARANGNSAIFSQLPSNLKGIASIEEAAFSPGVAGLEAKMANDPGKNRSLVADQISSGLNLTAPQASQFSASMAAPSLDGSFLSDLELSQLYKPGASASLIKLGTPSIAGKLCDPALTAVYVDAKAQVIHIVSSAYVLADSLRPLDREACTLAIPFSKPANKSLVFQVVDVHGLTAKRGTVRGQANVEAFLTGAHGQPITQQLLPTGNSTVVRRFLVRGASPITMGLGSSSGILRLNASLLAQAQDASSEGLVALDRITIRYVLK